MRLARGHERPIRRRGEPIIPLINVIFLLLIFVMLTMSIGPPMAFEVRLPRAASGLAEGEPELVVRAGSDGRLAIGRQTHTLESVLHVVRDEDGPLVLLEVDERLAAAEALALAKAIQEAGAARVDLAVARP